MAFDYDVVPGISSVSALAARHRTELNRVGRPVQITTGRRLAEGFPRGGRRGRDARRPPAFRAYADEDIDIYWGAYMGTPDEILVSRADLPRPRAGSSGCGPRPGERKGWIMDTYLLRRNPGPGVAPSGPSYVRGHGAV